MDSNDNARPQPQPSRFYEATFTDSATSPSDTLMVIIPEFSADQPFGDPDGVVWSPLGGVLPQAGDRALVAESTDGSWWVLSWWSDTQAVDTISHLRGRVNGDGTIAAGTGFSVVRNGAGDYTVTFSPAFGAVPVVQAMVGNGSGGLTIKEHPSATISASAVRLTLFTTATVIATDAPFSFIAEGAA